MAAPTPTVAAAAEDAQSKDGGAVQSEPAEEEDEGLQADPRRLMTELTAYRTLALAPCDRRGSRRRLSRGAACALPEGVLPLRLRLLPGDRPEKRRLRRAGARAWRHAARRNGRRAASRLGRAAAEPNLAICGTP